MVKRGEAGRRALRDEVYQLLGGAPEPAETGEEIVAAIKWVDGTVIDCVRETHW